MDRETLLKASKQGIISKEQVKQLVDFEMSETGAHAENSEEQLRFIRSFGDIFITLGIIFVSIATAQFEFEIYYQIIPIIILVATTEWLVRLRRLALPGIALLISTLYFTSNLIEYHGTGFDLNSLLLMTAVAFIFYWRYKMPFTLLPIAMGMIAIVSALIEFDFTQTPYLFVIFGLIVFMVAMWFDSRDIERKTRLSDSAFWLHLLAAPLVVHGVMVSLIIETNSLPFKEMLIIAFFVGFFLIALYVDRRAILVSSISYAIYAIVQLTKSNDFYIENLTLLIFVGFGVFIILFGVYWYKIRMVIFSKFSSAKLSKYVPVIIR